MKILVRIVLRFRKCAGFVCHEMRFIAELFVCETRIEGSYLIYAISENSIEKPWNHYSMKILIGSFQIYHPDLSKEIISKATPFFLKKAEFCRIENDQKAIKYSEKKKWFDNLPEDCWKRKKICRQTSDNKEMIRFIQGNLNTF